MRSSLPLAWQCVRILCGLSFVGLYSTLACGPIAYTQQPTAAPAATSSTIPANANQATLQSLIAQSKKRLPKSPNEYKEMQILIRDASKQLLQLLSNKPESTDYKQAQIDMISASVALMTFFSEKEQSATVKELHEHLEQVETLDMSDIQTGMLAANMLELQPNKKHARETYELLDRLLAEDKRAEMQRLRLNIQSSIARLGLLGNKMELKAKSISGKPIDVNDYAGKFVVVTFFSISNKESMTELSRIKSYYEKYRTRDLEVIAVNLDKSRAELDNYLKSNPAPWPVIHDIADQPKETLQFKFGISALPTVFLLNKEGVVVSLEARSAELDRIMDMLFEKPTTAPSQTQAADPQNAQPKPQATGSQAATQSIKQN